MSERREEDRNLWRIQRQVPNAGGLRHALRCECRLRVDVVQIGSAMSDREGAERVEMQKVGALEISVAVAKARTRNVPRVERPQAQGEDRAMSAQAPGGEPRSGSGGNNRRDHASVLLADTIDAHMLLNRTAGGKTRAIKANSRIRRHGPA